VSITKVTLDKKGDKKAVDLRKGGGTQPIHINLNWDNPNAAKKGLFGFGGGGGGAAPDLDLGCMFRLADRRMGVIQPLGNNFGAKDTAPYIFLDKDDRSGAAADGENLYIYRPDLIDTVMVFSLIYDGAPDFTSVGGRMTIRDQSGNEIFIRLNSPDRNLTFCAICTIKKVGNTIEIVKEERYFRNHQDADQHFGFGFNWRPGTK
jgi:tellurite resistance protein TerA